MHTADGKKKLVQTSSNFGRRPPARLFSVQDAMKSNNRSLQKQGHNRYIFNAQEFEDGYLLKDMKVNAKFVTMTA